MDNLILKIKDGVEASAFDDGNENKTYLIRFNNRHWKVSEIIYHVLCSINGFRTIAEIKEYLDSNYSIQIEEQKLKQIIDMAFVQNGILEGSTSVSVPPKNKMLWGRITLVKPNIIGKFKLFSFLFNKAYIITLGSIVILWIIYLNFMNTNNDVIDKLFQLDVKDIILCYIFIFLTGLVHEFGHSIATMSYGEMPGRIGAGVYFIMPVLFSDVTCVWKLKRQQRAVVDLGGMYLQGVFLVLFYILNTFIIKNNLITIGIFISGFQILGNFNPFIKLDGYWVLSDFLGVTEIKSVIFQLWLDLFRKLRHKPQKSLGLSKEKKAVIYLYSILGVCFFLYFFRFLVQSLILSVQNISSDILSLYKVGILGLNITFNGIVQYISLRATTIIVLIFYIRILWSLVFKKIIMKCKTTGRSIKEASYGESD